MKGTAKSKVVTSGRLTGRAKVQLARRRVTSNPRPAASPEPAYSLYSTDSEDQVTSLHKGLDRCAALLSGILQAEKAEASPSFPRAVKGGGAAKSRPSASLRQKTIKKLPTQAAPDQKRCQSVQCGPGRTTPRSTPQSAVPAAHSGVKLHPPQKQPQNLLQPLSHCQTLSSTTPPPQSQLTIPPSQTSIPPPHPSPHSGRMPLPKTDCHLASEAPHIHCKAECEEDFVPVRDINNQSTATDIHPAVRQKRSHTHSCTLKMSNMQLEPGQLDGPQDTPSREDCRAAERL